ncbi:MAG: SRPBCC family protein [Gemmatimonadales bacterium]|nr:SRPBCC family protein [Gemmatimonadales bacterium]
MGFLIRVGLGIAVIVGLAAAWGASMPREHVAASRIVLSQPIDQVFAVVRNPAALVGTWGDLSQAERVAGPGNREVWEQVVGGDPMRIIITSLRPPTQMVTTIDAPPDAVFGGTWTYQLRPVPEGTEVTLTEAGWIANPLFRVMSRVIGHHTTLEGYLKALGQHFTQGVRPERLQ